jgi:hypothetical protein
MPKHFLWFVLLGFWLALLPSADASSKEVTAAAAPRQELLPLEVIVVDPDGQPVAGAKILPWALRSSQGHGLWRSNDNGDPSPTEVTTDAAGNATVDYPRLRNVDERVRTTQVTLSIDHPEFARVEYEHIDVPRSSSGPHEVTLQRGATVEVAPTIDGRPTPTKNLYALWGDSRSWKVGFQPETTAEGALRIPPMPVGVRQVLVARLEAGKVTHFSPIVDLELKEGPALRQAVELRPAARIEGSLSANVPRPVINGRISARTLADSPEFDSVEWLTWAPVAEDGTFVIDAWPAGEDIQIVALSDHFIATSGKPPAVVDPKRAGAYYRAQVFAADEYARPIVIDMTPLVRCEVKAVDGRGNPLEGVEINSWPNVGWWNSGSQVYCTPLARGERLLVNRDFYANVDNPYPPPFAASTDAAGRAVLYLPAGNESLNVNSEAYELPVTRGRRDQKVVLPAGLTTQVDLVLQPKGTEHLGDWDKLAGVLFGCTGEECRRLLEDQGFRKKMVKVGELFDGAADPHDPAMLKQAYAEIAQGFDELKDQEEANRWRSKSAEQAAKLATPDAAKPASE